MTANVLKRDNPVIRYLRIAFHEAVIWNYMPLICVPTVWLTLFFTREYYFSGDSAGREMIGVTYAVLLILGICMGMIAAGHLFNGKKREAYSMLPCDRSGIMAVRLITMLVLCFAVIFAVYVVFYLFTGMEEPYFYSHEAYAETVAPSAVMDVSGIYNGAVLWCMYGMMAFSEAIVPFVMGYGIGALCSVLASFVMFSVFHAIFLLAVNAVAISPYTVGFRGNGVKYDTIAVGFSPVWFIVYVLDGENVSIDSFAPGWFIVSGIFILLAILLSRYTRIERRHRFLSCGSFILFCLLFIVLSVAVFALRELAPDAVIGLLERLFGINHPVF